MNNIKTNSRYYVDTPSGFQPFHGIRKLTKFEHFVIKLSNGKTIKCSLEHPFIYNNTKLIASDLSIGSCIDSTNDEKIYVSEIQKVNSSIDLYDLINVNGGNIFNVDGIVSHNCEFSTSGDQVIHMDSLNFQKEFNLIDPLEKRGIDKDYWIFKQSDYNRQYLLSADCARGDGSDFSAFQVIDTESLEQVAEYKGKLTTKEYGNLLITAATEYNNALLIVENSNVGWATIQQILDRGYDNLFYNEMDLNIIEADKQYTSKINTLNKKSVPGFSTTSKSRPLIINKMEEYFNEKTFIMHSQRLYEELMVFIWNGAKAEAMKGYNDDLVMSLAIGLWVRDTALRIRTERTSYAKSMLTGIKKSNNSSQTFYTKQQNASDSWKFNIDSNTNDDLKWLL